MEIESGKYERLSLDGVEVTKPLSGQPLEVVPAIIKGGGSHSSSGSFRLLGFSLQRRLDGLSKSTIMPCGIEIDVSPPRLAGPVNMRCGEAMPWVPTRDIGIGQHRPESILKILPVDDGNYFF